MEQQIKENRNNTNTMWKVIRSCIPKKSASQSSFSGDVNTVANEFNNFFVNIGKNTIQIKSAPWLNNSSVKHMIPRLSHGNTPRLNSLFSTLM